MLASPYVDHFNPLGAGFGRMYPIRICVGSVADVRTENVRPSSAHDRPKLTNQRWMYCNALIGAIICLSIQFCFAPCFAQAPTKPAASKAPDLPEPVAIARIRTARTSVESYVKILKARHATATAEFDKAKRANKPNSEAYKNAQEKFTKQTEIIDGAQRKYIAAYSAYDGWLTALKTGIVAGNSDRLAKDDHYKSVADDASKAATEFVSYAGPYISKDQRGAIGFIAVLGSLAKMGIDVWQAYSKGQAALAKDYAEYVGSQLQWREWDKI
jgi:hypothetical protein